MISQPYYLTVENPNGWSQVICGLDTTSIDVACRRAKEYMRANWIRHARAVVRENETDRIVMFAGVDVAPRNRLRKA
jgi:hypothetical protein